MEKKKKDRQWGRDLSKKPYSIQIPLLLQHIKGKQRVCQIRRNKDIFAGNASLGIFQVCVRVWELVCIQHWQRVERLNEWGRCTTHSQSRTCWEPNTHLGQQQHTHWRTNAAPSYYRLRGEEGEYLNAWSFFAFLFFYFFFQANRVLIWAQLKSTAEVRASKAVFFFYLAQCRLCCDCQLSGPSESQRSALLIAGIQPLPKFLCCRGLIKRC